MKKNHRYTEKEIKKILKLALNRLDEDETYDPENGLTIEEVIEIGKEAGIKPEQIKVAAERVRNTSGFDRAPAVADKSEICAKRWIPGRLTERQVENLFAELKRNAGLQEPFWGSPGGVTRLGDTWEFNGSNANITVTDSDTGYVVQVTKSQFFDGSALEATILGFPVAFLIGVLPASAAYEFLGIPWAIMAAILAYVAGFFYIKNYTRKKRKEERDHLKILADQAESTLNRYAKGGQGMIDIPESSSKDDGIPNREPDQKIR